MQQPRNSRGWLLPTDDYLRRFLNLPELALLAESCAAEHALHAALHAAPTRTVSKAELQALQDADVRDSYALFLRFRDALLATGTLEAYYLSLFPRHGAGTQGGINIPPLFIDMLVEAITRNLWQDADVDLGDVYALRAAHMLHRSQRISTQNGQVLSGDQRTLDMLNETGGLGDIGRFLAEAKAPLQTIELQVLSDDNASEFVADWLQVHQGGGRHRFLLDLTHEVSNDLSHGLVLTMTRARSGLKALANVLQKWCSIYWGLKSPSGPCKKLTTTPGAGTSGSTQSQTPCSMTCMKAVTLSQHACSGLSVYSGWTLSAHRKCAPTWRASRYIWD